MNNRQKKNLMKYALIAFVIYLVWRKMSSGYGFIKKPECKIVMEPCPPPYIEKGGICMTTKLPFKFLHRKSREVCEQPTKVAEPVNPEKAGMKSEAVKNCRTICE